MRSGSASFGEELRARRVRARLTQQELADRAGVSVRAVRYIEQGKVARPRADSVRRLGAALGLSVERWPERGTDRLWIGVLGRLEVVHGGRPVDGGTLKQRSLLGLLALHANQVVTRSEIIDVLWGDDPPDSCQNLVHTYVSRLRKAIAPGPVPLISAQRGGYLLAVQADQLDLLRFDRLLGRAREAPPRAAVGLYQEALHGWRGPLLADLPAGVRHHPAALAVTARRLTTALDYADLALSVGAPGQQLVEQLRALAREEPLHEGLHARLMLALAGSGQQAAALRLFTELRRRLGEELGVQPGAEIRAAHLRIVRQGGPVRAAAARRPVPAQLPADVAGFAGRSEDLDRLDRLLPRAGRDTAVMIATVTGSAGVGKTALAVHWAHRVRDRFPDGQLYVNLRGCASGPPAPPLEALTHFLRALGVPAERVPVDAEEAANLYRTRLADRRTLILLDDAAGAEQVRPLLPGSPGCMVVVTSRDRLTGLVAKEGARRIGLDVLDAGDSRALLAGMLGDARVLAEPDAVEELGRICAHLPLALRIAAANLLAAPARGIADYTAELRDHGRLGGLTIDGEDRGPVRAAFDLSYARLEPGTRRLFRLLGLVPGPDFTHEAAAALAGGSIEDARRALGQLAAAHLVQQQVAGRYQFHDLLRDYAAEAARREDADECHAAVERLLDFYLRTADQATRLLYPHVLRLARPAAEGGAGPAEPATESAALDWLEAERANLVAAAVPGSEYGVPSYAWRIADTLRGYFISRGLGGDGLAVCAAALSAAERMGDEAGEASAHDVLGLIHYNLGDFRLAMACHTNALEINRRIGNPSAEASSLHNLGRACAHLGQPARAARFHERALEINRRIGDRHGEAIALNYIGSAALVLGQPDTAYAHSSQALRLSREIGDRHVEARSLNSLGLIMWKARSHEAAERYFAEALRLAREIGFSYAEASVLIGLSRVRRSTGRPAEAIAHCQEALAVMRDRGIHLFEGRVLAELAYAHLELGEVEQAAAHAQRALDVVRRRRQRLIEARALHVLGLAYRATGDTDLARAHWRAALTIFTEIGAPEEHAVRELLAAG
ncbi:MAG TPA: tetratricopeptide repeat protein [Actinophytocola sp.]|uniref:tetratricopeptide repeat protein n=1 Tax=Actinophytocola sp. TaxID=1872138 RepID=UPI002DDD7456|nr:tetratricopeptide repeat protein [Actinophytocola sp.]HEV2783639.1 tetratricopeptide repeat protein [Actinophytocola sp.]